jgi:hypothetical protein
VLGDQYRGFIISRYEHGLRADLRADVVQAGNELVRGCA